MRVFFDTLRFQSLYLLPTSFHPTMSDSELLALHNSLQNLEQISPFNGTSMQISVFEQTRFALHSAVILAYNYGTYDVLALNQIIEKQNHLIMMIKNQNQLKQDKEHFETIDEALRNCPTPADENVDF